MLDIIYQFAKDFGWAAALAISIIMPLRWLIDQVY